MGTRIEDFSTELCLEFFSYLNVRDRFNAFFNLNQRLNQILLSHENRISWKDADQDAQYLLKHVLPVLPDRNRVVALRLENFRKVRSLHSDARSRIGRLITTSFR